MGLLLLASEELTHKTWWNPYAKGFLVFFFAVMLFVGSAYLLLYTNVGSRLGFLLTAGAFTGFLTILSIFWITGQFPQGPLGRLPRWQVKEVVESPAQSKYDAVRRLTEKDAAAPEIAGPIKADLDAQIAQPETHPKDNLFTKADAYFANQTRETGGGRKWPWWWSEKTAYAVTEVCPMISQVVPFGEAPPAPQCAPDSKHQWVVTIHDLGAQRQPAFFLLGGGGLLFGLVLLSLRRYEQDEQARLAPPAGPGGEGDGHGDGPGGDSSDEASSDDSASEPAPATA